MTEVKHTPLLPCPFCGGQARVTSHPRDERFGYVGVNTVECLVCTAKVTRSDPQSKNGWATGSGRDAAIQGWNTRVNSHADLVEALRSIAEQDSMELALDPDWPKRIAKATLSKLPV